MRRLYRFPLAATFVAAALLSSFFVGRAGAQDSTLTVERELMDDSVKAEEPFDLSTGSFTVAIRAKLIEPGNEKGNNDGNVMLWNVANGWDRGMRVIFQWQSSRLAFQIGGEGGKGRGCYSPRGYFTNVMRDVVATYDAESKKMSLYVDGELAQSEDCDVTPTTDGQPLNVGFGGSGVGSARMYVDKAETWTRALTAEEIADRENARSAQERSIVDVLRGVETLSSAAPNLDGRVEAIRNALTLELPQKAQERLRADLLAAFVNRDYQLDRNLDTSDYDEFAALVFAKADAALAEPEPASESEEGNAEDASEPAAETSETDDAATAEETSASVDVVVAPVSKEELEAYGTLKEELARLRRVSTGGSTRVRNLMSSTSFNDEQNRAFREKARGVLDRFGLNAARAENYLKRLDERYAREAMVFEKIGKLEDSAERVRRIERDSLGVYYSLTTTPKTEKYARRVFVSTIGSDETGNGSTRAPYATLARAFRDVEEKGNAPAEAGKPVPKTVIEVAPGTYFTTAPATLKNATNVQVVGAKEGKAILTGSRRIDNFTPLEKSAESNDAVAAAWDRFPKDARGAIFTADLKAAGVENLGALHNRGYHGGDKVEPIPTFTLNGKAQTLARWPNDGEETLKFGEAVEDPEGAPEGSSTFRYDFDRVDGWKVDGSEDIWAFGLFEWEWAANFRRVLKIDRDAKTIAFDYATASGRFDYYFVNVPEELDAPGEYYVDRESGVLYFYPPEGIETAEALNAAVAEFDEYEGRFIELENDSDVVVSNIVMTSGRETAVAMKNCNRSYVSDCSIEQMGGNGVVINGGEFCGVVNSRLRSLGGCGIRMTGGDPDTLKPCRHLVHNNYVSDFSRIDRVYAPAVSAEGCGFAITNNLFCDSPHHAMRTDGQDIYVARNEIHSVVYEYSDQAGIDIYCDPSYRGIVIERNLWRHIGSAFALCGQAGIRLDDSISGVVMKENVFYRSSGGQFGGIQIHGGKDNLVIGNAFVDCLQATSFSVWGGDRYEKFVKERFPKHVDSELYKATYPFFDEIFEHIDRNYVLDNKAINCGQFNRNGDSVDVFVGNTLRAATPDLAKLGVKGAELEKSPADVFYTNEKALRAWLTIATGISLKDVGLKANWNDAGEPVSPKFIGGAGAEE